MAGGTGAGGPWRRRAQWRSRNARRQRLPATPAGRWAGPAFAVAVGYYLAARLGFIFTLQPHPISILWAPNALLAAALLAAAPAGAHVTIIFSNDDANVAHDLVLRDPSGAKVGATSIFNGPGVEQFEFSASVAGRYGYLCTVHRTMSGALIVE